MTSCIAAFTELGKSMPGYVSINFTDDGDIVVTVRDATTGVHAGVQIPAYELIRLAGAIVKNPEVLSKAVCQALVMTDGRKKP